MPRQAPSPVSDVLPQAAPDVPDPTASEPAAPAPVTNARLAIGLLVSSAFVMILNETIMSVALPVLVGELGVSIGTVQWLTSGFLLTMAVVIPITGFLLQRFTPRQVFLASMALFCAGTLIAGLAAGFPMLMAGRVVQASGTAVMLPLLMTSVMRLIPPERLGATMGTLTVVIAMAPAIGPTLSGLILSTLGWRWMFLTVLPIALLALAAGARWLRVVSESRKVPLDVISVPLSAVAFGGLVFGLSSVGDAARGQALVAPWLPTTIGLAVMVVFVTRQLRLQRENRALLDLRPLAVRPFLLSVILLVLGMMSLFGAVILLPLWLQDVRGVSPLVTGLMVLPGGLAMGLLGPFVGRLYDRFGARTLITPGSLLLTAALWGFTTFGPTTALWLIVVLHMALMASLSCLFTPLMTDALRQLPREIDSYGSAIMATCQQLAGAAGTALFITVMTLATTGPTAGADEAGTRAAFVCAAIIATLAPPITLLIRRPPATAEAPTAAH